MQDDHAWMGVDEENYTIPETDQVSQASSPDNLKNNSEDMDYVDIEGGITPGEDDSIPAKLRRGRGRPKKKSATLEEGMQNYLN